MPRSRHAQCSRHARRAFTLVELLVVIGIIALLISILLPALNRARAQANTVKCLANLRSIGQSIVIYAGMHKGTLPYGRWDGSSTAPDGSIGANADTLKTSDWSTLLFTKTIGRTNGGVTFGELAEVGGVTSNVFTCPAAQPGTGRPEYRTLHYASHPRLMPDLDDGDQSFLTPYPLMRPYKIAKIKQSSEIALIWDASQRLRGTTNVDTDGNANAVCRGIDANGLFRDGADNENGHTFNLLLAGPRIKRNGGVAVGAGATVNLDQAVFATNAESTGAGGDPRNTSDIRWRHAKNDTANFIYADGHADTRRLKFGKDAGFKLRNLYVNR